MDIINRNNCVITGKNDLEKLINLEDFPVFIGATSEPFASDKFHDMSLNINVKIVK